MTHTDVDFDAISKHIESQHAGSSSQTIKSVVYGGVDGVITTFSIIAASHGASLSYHVIILLALSNLFADAFSMGFGDFTSSRLESNYIRSEEKKERYEYEVNRDGEIAELVCLYEREGMTVSDAKTFVDILVNYEDLFIQQMMLQELGLESCPEYDCEIAKTATYTFLSFLFRK